MAKLHTCTRKLNVTSYVHTRQDEVKIVYKFAGMSQDDASREQAVKAHEFKGIKDEAFASQYSLE